MNRTIQGRYLVQLAVALLLIGAGMTGCAAPAGQQAQPTSATSQQTLNIKLGSFWGGGHCQQMMDLFMARAEEASGGHLQFTLMPGDTAVPVDEHFNALGKGVFDLNYMAEEYYQKEIPAFYVLNGIPGMLKGVEDGPRLATLGGWNELRDRLYAQKNSVHAGMRPIAADAVISRIPLNSIDDVKGVKIRSTGFNAEVFTALGASTVFTPQDEVYVSLSSGLVDAAESGNALSQFQMGFHEVAKYWIQPDLTNCGMGLNLGANADFWKSLSAADKAIIEMAFESAARTLNDEAKYQIGGVLQDIQANYGVTVIYWSEKDLKKWSDTYMELMPQYPQDPFWVEALKLIQDYAKVMGYA